MARIFLTKTFDKWASNEGLTDQQLQTAVEEIDTGLVDANLGGSVFKKRIGINGKGKSSSLRTIVAFRSEKGAFFVHGFSKSDRGNINQKEKAALKEQAKVFFDMDEKSLSKALNVNAFREITV